MFTGIVKELGKIQSIRPNAEGVRLEVASRELLPHIEVDDSVAINGVCQTAVKVNNKTFEVQCVHTSLEKTSLGDLGLNDPVNLELALRPMDRMGGHFVQGHVNGLGHIKHVDRRGDNINLYFSLDPKLHRYVVQEGSIALEGVSLTVAQASHAENRFHVTLIPHTYENTVFKHRNVGDAINVEVDILAKYMENLIFQGDGTNKPKNPSSGLSEEWIRQQGY